MAGAINLLDHRAALMALLVQALAVKSGFSQGKDLAPNIRRELTLEAEAAVDEFFVRIQDEFVPPTSPVETLLAEIYDLDGQIFDLMQTEPGPSGRLH